MLNLTYKYNKSFSFYYVLPDQNIMKVWFIGNNINVILISNIYKAVKIVFYGNNRQITNEKIIYYVNKKPWKSNKFKYIYIMTNRIIIIMN